MPDTISITMMTLISLHTTAGLARLLDAFESIEACKPTHWGPDERARNPYERHDLVAAVSSFPDEFYVPGLHRRRPSRYQAFFSAKDSGLKYVKIDFGTKPRQKDLPSIFSLGDALAEQLEAEYGFVHPIWRLGERSQKFSAAGVIRARDFQENGPKPVCVRTWYGPHLVGLIGRERLTKSGALIHETSWQGVQLDLVERPWEADFETLSARQLEVMRHLDPSGVFGDYTIPVKPKPGPDWVPIPI